MRRFRPIVEDMAQVGVALGACDRGAHHAESCVGISVTFSFAIGCQKLGHPVPDSNFVAESNSALSQQMQR